MDQSGQGIGMVLGHRDNFTLIFLMIWNFFKKDV
jgi:hypothetical protein